MLLRITSLICLGIFIAAGTKAWLFWRDAGEIVHDLHACIPPGSSGELSDSERLVVLAQHSDINIAARDSRVTLVNRAIADRRSDQTLEWAILARLSTYRLSMQATDEACIKADLDTAYFGKGEYGIEAAVTSLFPGHTDALSLDEAATLAAILRVPRFRDNPDQLARHAEAARKRLEKRLP